MCLFKKLIKDITPPLILKVLQKMFGSNIRFKGNYSSWAEALSRSTGYDQECILKKVEASVEEVLAGRAAFERDSVAFLNREINWPVVATILRAAVDRDKSSDNKIRILDFGGSLGSLYFQNRVFLPESINFEWNIVEQPRFVEVGKNKFEDSHLKFHFTIADCLHKGAVDLVLLSSVLPYVPEPYKLIEDLKNIGARYILIERTPLLSSQLQDRLTVQHIPAKIYKASYPAWFLSEVKIIQALSEKYSTVEKIDSLGCWQLDGLEIKDVSLILQRRI